MAKLLKAFVNWIGLKFRSAASELVWILVGLILGVVLSGPIKLWLMHIWPFYFLDDKAPRIESISPDLTVNKLISDLPLRLIVRVRDEGIGLDVAACSAEICSAEDERLSPFKFLLNKSDSVFEISPIDSIGVGAYTLNILLIDKASNKTIVAFPFIVLREKQIFIARRGRCSEKEKAAYFSDYFDSQKKYSFSPPKYEFYVMEIFVSNNTKKGYLKDLYFSADVGNVVLSCKFVGGIDVGEFEAYNVSESWDRTMPKFQVFTSQWFFRIGEIAPMGVARIKLLIGLDDLSEFRDQLQNSLDINGSYIFDGYGLHIPRELHQSISVQL